MARDKAWAAEFHRRMEEFDAARGIKHAAPLPPRRGPTRATVSA